MVAFPKADLQSVTVLAWPGLLDRISVSLFLSFSLSLSLSQPGIRNEPSTISAHTPEQSR